MANKVSLDQFWTVVRAELKRLGPFPRTPLTVTRAAEIAGVSKNTAGKYIDILEARGKIVIVLNLPRKDLYLSDYSNGNEGEGVER